MYFASLHKGYKYQACRLGKFHQKNLKHKHTNIRWFTLSFVGAQFNSMSSSFYQGELYYYALSKTVRISFVQPGV